MKLTMSFVSRLILVAFFIQLEIHVIQSQEVRSKFIGGGCKGNVAKCEELCLSKFDMIHGKCSKDDCFCLRSTVDHAYNRIECKKNSSVCFFVYSIGQGICHRDKSTCEFFCKKWYQTDFFKCDEKSSCNCWEFDYGTTQGNVEARSSDVSRTRVIKHTNCRTHSECKRYSNATFPYHLCIYGNCYCMKDPTALKPYKNCLEQNGIKKCQIVYDLGKDLCSIEHKGPCATTCANALGAELYSCHRVDKVCRCFFPIPGQPLDAVKDRGLYLKGYCKIPCQAELVNALSKETCANMKCLSSCESKEFNEDSVEIKFALCVKKDCYCLKKPDYVEPGFKCSNNTQNCMDEVVLGKSFCGTDSIGACAEMCLHEYRANIGLCVNGHCVCHVHPTAKALDITGISTKDEAAYYFLIEVTAECQEVRRSYCYSVCHGIAKDNFRHQICVHSEHCMCLGREGEREPMYDECKAKKCIEAISLGRFICKGNVSVECSRFCKMEFRTLMHGCTKRLECVCGVMLTKDPLRQIGVSKPILDKKIPFITRNKIDPSYVQVLKDWHLHDKKRIGMYSKRWPAPKTNHTTG